MNTVPLICLMDIFAYVHISACLSLFDIVKSYTSFVVPLASSFSKFLGLLEEPTWRIVTWSVHVLQANLGWHSKTSLVFWEYLTLPSWQPKLETQKSDIAPLWSELGVWSHVVIENFQFFSHSSTSVRNSESNWNYVFLFDKVWICYEFLKCSMHHGPKESIRTNKIWIHHAYFVHLLQS